MTTTQQHSTKQDIVQQLIKRGQATAHELAKFLDISPQAIRRHLKDLEAEGAIEYESVQVGMGRPQHIYQLTSQGRDRFPKRYDEFAISFLDTLTETVGYEQVSQILQKQWQRKALEYREKLGNGSVKERVAKLVELRKAEGYMAEWYPVESPSEKAEQYVLTEHNCAISNVAESFPSVCGHELEMFSAVLFDCTVERTHWIVNGEHRCGYLISSGQGIVTSDQLTVNSYQ
ncbi:iron-sulfur cluster biosynthesis transcriptional regulator SufR [Limnoraphis robusta]|uniref:Iron-sulfur cluster biosynthesis transcriptional regulator SufR n=1 Tax=Limnoraphis robusta CCNP1315 TaxID=3110306 RepID=A0ABU5U2J5_9CYAN|nr:iron-sulfur cluster biosynthesis transcriptional regulator SufR [Limnoraphis robusta]MEA5521290.1 iron-sulfur cluster biosynthesis transcriptional regulator SufR [Limnoraphis robusta CCNP1315]MEA5544866.1 iron-sulfur cluster biosynthesis transcriptional regulator SufR [Limnoraphis robusta CCNP1324]